MPFPSAARNRDARSGFPAPSSSGPWSPADLPALALWLDASDSSSFTFGSGVDVAEWRDKSGNGRHFSQTTPTNQPKRTGTQNALPTVVFTGSSAHHMAAGDTLDLGTANLSVFVAGSYSAGGGPTQAFLAKSQLGSLANRYALLKIDAGNFAMLYQGPSGAGVNAQTANVTTWQRWGGIVDRPAGQVSVRRGGTQQAITPVTVDVSPNDSTFLLVLGVYNNAVGGLPGSFYLDGEIAEIIVTLSALVGDNLTNLEQYLADKWALP